MKSRFGRGSGFAFALLLSLLCFCPATHAQRANPAGELRLDDLDRLARRASEVVNIRMDERLLRAARSALARDPGDEPDEAAIKDLIKGVRSIHVRSLGFDTEGAYAASDLAALREQLRAPGWERFLEVRSRRDKIDVEVYVLLDGERVESLAVVSAEPKELTVINIVGDVDMEKLARLQGQFGIPDLELEPAPAARETPKQKPTTNRNKQP